MRAGYDAMPGSLMARLNVEGNSLMYELAKKLQFTVKNIGSLVVCTSERDMEGSASSSREGVPANVPDLRLLTETRFVP